MIEIGDKVYLKPDVRVHVQDYLKEKANKKYLETTPLYEKERETFEKMFEGVFEVLEGRIRGSKGLGKVQADRLIEKLQKA